MWSRRKRTNQAVVPSAPPVTDVDVREAARLQSGGHLLLDVREPWEFARVHAKGARLVPLGELHRRSADLDRGTPILVICQSGNRSRGAAAHLRAAGLQAINVKGGTGAWVRAGLPTG